MMTVAILALQGAFIEHKQMIESLGADTVLIRNLNDWLEYVDGYLFSFETSANEKSLIIPGGESTTITKLMKDEGLWQPIKDAITAGMPVFGTCAGLIMLDNQHLDVMDIKVKRNAYGRQLGSFITTDDVKNIGHFPMVFIRAPYIEHVGNDVEVLACHDGHIIAARQQNMLVTAFHPELTEDDRIHRFFVNGMKP